MRELIETKSYFEKFSLDYILFEQELISELTEDFSLKILQNFIDFGEYFVKYQLKIKRK